MKPLATLLFLLLAGCTTISDLTPTTQKLYLLLPEDYVRIQTRGIGRDQFGEGLKAGEYTAFAEDKDGIYFRGKGKPVIVLAGKSARSYEKEKQIPAEILNREDIYPRPLNVGGIWLPKQGVNKEAKLFFEVPDPRKKGGISLGIAAESITDAVVGSVAYIPFGSEKEFIDGLIVIQK